MIDFLIAYLAVGWLCASLGSCFFMVREGEGYDPSDFLRIIPLWPVLAIYVICCLVMKMIEWGLDD